MSSEVVKTLVLTERAVQLRVVQSIRSGIVVAAPNYTPTDWWECDLWAVTRAGYAVEYEIKLTLGDFRADKEKARCLGRRWNPETKKREFVSGEKKHDSIGSPVGPSRFFYVVPRSIAEQVATELPEFAGLGVISDGYCWPSWIKAAPQLHKTKASRREIRLAQTRMWQRYWNCIGAIEEGLREKASPPCSQWA